MTKEIRKKISNILFEADYEKELVEAVDVLIGKYEGYGVSAINLLRKVQNLD